MRPFVPSQRVVQAAALVAFILATGLLLWVIVALINLGHQNEVISRRLDVAQADGRTMKSTLSMQGRALAEANRRLRGMGAQPVVTPVAPEPVSGADGQPGQKGDQGLAGARGPVGAQGRAGRAGHNGAAGSSGRNGSDGTTGPRGADGAKGDTGPAGPAGADGKDGSDGKDGAQGAAGPAGYPESFTYTTGAPGPAVTFVCTDPDGDHAYTCDPTP